MQSSQGGSVSQFTTGSRAEFFVQPTLLLAKKTVDAPRCSTFFQGPTGSRFGEFSLLTR